jgi:hypothetical protein|tara:strand:- start:16306 stop:16881 length:576 start_codon:yes stop_codon:yes gene_type:complete
VEVRLNDKMFNKNKSRIKRMFWLCGLFSLILIIIGCSEPAITTQDSGSGQVQTIEDDGFVFDENYCLGLLGSHVTFGRLEFKDNLRTLTRVAKIDNSGRIMVSFNADSEEIKSCEVYIVKNILGDTSDFEEHTCDEGFKLSYDQEKLPSYSKITTRIRLDNEFTDSVLYINSNIEDLESIKESRLRTLDCK